MDKMARSFSLKNGFENPAGEGIGDRDAQCRAKKQEPSFLSETGPEKYGCNHHGQKKIPGIRDIKHDRIEPGRVRRKDDSVVEGKIERLQKCVQWVVVSYGLSRLFLAESSSSLRSEIIFSRLSIRSRNGSGIS